MKDFSYITSSHPAFIESLYQEYVQNPTNVDPELKKFFEGFDFAISNVNGNGKPGVNGNVAVDSTQLTKEFSVYQLIQAYRKKAHLVAKTNPIRPRKDRRANLELSYFGLGDADLKTTFEAGKFIGLGKATLQAIVDKLTKIYATTVGVEYSALNDMERIEWLAQAVEDRLQQPVSLDQKKHILGKLNEGVIFEKFLHTKYIGQKRFSLEGGESLIPALDAIINKAAANDVKEVVIGMAHRGRLNVLANTLGKTYEQIFTEFEGVIPADKTMGSGDVKYHLGFSSNHTTPAGGSINVQLCPNPSHLEVVNPIVLGFARSKANVLYNADYDKILPILIHGDAALAGQGIVYETAQMSELPGYHVGGTIHIVINNQIGFTTDFDDARSSDYCTAVAAITQSPVLHINGDDAEAVVKAVEIATDYRQRFNSDIYIDILCYRRHGHNEGDEPKFTQPNLYALIEKHPNPREVYIQYLLQNGEPDAQELAKEMEKKFWADLQERLDEVRQKPIPYTFQKPEEWWRELRRSTETDFDKSPETAISAEEVTRLFNGLMKKPDNFSPLKKVEKLLQDKVKVFEAEQKIDWATGELLAYSSILVSNKDVRLSGEDVKRGTFSHRHAVMFDENTNEQYNRLNHFQEQQGKLRVFNSLLSEYGVLGFEYGFGMANPNSLVVWEAQYGDFANGAQMIIDQYIASAEQKWGTMSGVVLLLPHGYEGGGPDHSSARLERFLQMSAEMNMIVTNITTAANFFHALRRQLAWPFRKPLINMSPKANLRHAGSYSHISEFTQGGFKEVIDDATVANKGKVKKVLLCSGKIYFELAERKQKENREDVAVVRLEQIYPLPVKQLEALYQQYGKAVWYWVQEEPLNMGAASFLQMNLKTVNYGIISRNASASTATGFAKVHAVEQADIIDTAFNI
ncbi:2-oxoglutarate dehydrogenase E1 component [Filimonas lacunae]|uniref:oxoglutarate dehydrogenase (succinyl-transferring) n=1 Tax=Filimonas lacunae TaxID=477680 RepID=A0A173MAN6_9BACT|nr:2-oxoglutarate dehydrogenase E1 component [Filimonas lacunae]BAV04580.1 2-oxoglutarate dehydrogenase E1 component [Filimonas lacunae]SIT32771.1 2-oxoglutarate dehydrogenase E1 component [Filimonas lacunae]